MAPAAPAMTVEVETQFDNTVVIVDVPATATVLNVWRVGPSRTPAHVRGFMDAPVVPGELVLRDYELPLGVPVTYHAQVSDGTDLSAEATPVTVTVPAGACEAWLVDLANPANSQEIVLESLEELQYEVPSGIHYVLDRRDPIVTSDIARTPRFELVFVTETDGARVRARATLGNGYPVLLRTTPLWAIGNLYLVAPTFVEQRMVTDGANPLRRHVLQATQIARPDPDLWLPLVPTETYAAVKAEFATYAALEAARDSYDELLHVEIGGPPAEVVLVPWPPTDV